MTIVLIRKFFVLLRSYALVFFFLYSCVSSADKYILICRVISFYKYINPWDKEDAYLTHNIRIYQIISVIQNEFGPIEK